MTVSMEFQNLKIAPHRGQSPKTTDTLKFYKQHQDILLMTRSPGVTFIHCPMDVK